MPRYELSDGTSHKFWQIERRGAEVVTQWGRIGTTGQSKTKAFTSEAAAEAEVGKQTAKKLGKGYVAEGTPAAAAPTPSTLPGSEGDVADGEERTVPGSGGRTYVVRNVAGVYSCSCPAWRNQSMPIEQRSCKHLRRLRGEAAETARVGSAPVRRASPATEGPPLLLAATWDPDVHDPAGWWMSEKLDGVRAYWDGRRFLSRLGNEFLAPAWFTQSLPDVPLDGELFAGRGAFHRAVSIARRADRSDAWRELRFLVFDGPAIEGGFEDRLARLHDLGEGWRGGHLEVLTHTACTGADAVHAELDRIAALGGEGVMLRQPGSAYVQGRSDTLLKVKRFHDLEATVVGHVAGSGRHKGRLGALRCEMADGTLFKVGTGFSDAEREDPPPIGALVTVRYQELTRAGVPRFPTFVRLRGHDV